MELIDSGHAGFDAATGAVLATALGLLGVMLLVLALRVVWFFIRWIPAGPGKKRALWVAVVASWNWRRACIALGLYETQERTYVRDGKILTKTVKKVPRIRIKVDDFGVHVMVRTLPKVGREELTKHAQHFADTWGCTRVAVHQTKPGRVVIRGVLTDPLTQNLDYTPPPADADPFTVDLGIDEWADPTEISLHNIPGISVAGLPGYGKSALVNRWIVRWAPSTLVQIAALDGKGGGDFDDVEPRLFYKGGDDVYEANEFLRKLEDHRRERSDLLRSAFGTKSIWNTPGRGRNGGTGPGFTEDWPLLVVILDEAHTFFVKVPDGGDRKLKERNAKAAENAQLVTELIKKGRSVGILVLLLTQKPTSDAIPTAMRDNCPIGVSFALKTDDAAVAALGADIRHWPDANPVNLQGEDYRLVLTLARQDAPGFKRVRAAYVPDEHAAKVAADNADKTRDPFETIKTYARKRIPA